MITKGKKRKEIKIAKESSKTKKVREKLERRLQLIERKITPEELQKKRIEIHHWIARHAQHRVVLKDKNISLFDENENAAQSSQKVKEVLLKLQENFSSPFKV